MSQSSPPSDRPSGQTIDPILRALLVCPLDWAELREIEQTLTCSVCGRVYPVGDRIPDMVVRVVD